MLVGILGVAGRQASMAAETTFNVTAATERLSFVVRQEPQFQWILDSVRVFTDTGSDTGSFPFTGQFSPAGNTTTTINRVAAGRLSIFVESNGLQGSAGRFFSAADESPGEKAPPSIEFVVDDVAQRAARGHPIIISLAGHVTLGRDVYFETRGGPAGVLRSGRVSLLSRSMIGERLVVARNEELMLGDTFTADSLSSTSLGFALAGEEPGLSVAYRVAGQTAIVTRPGGGHYAVYASWLDRVSSDPFVLRIALVFGVVAAIIGLAIQIVEVRSLLVSTRAAQDAPETV